MKTLFFSAMFFGATLGAAMAQSAADSTTINANQTLPVASAREGFTLRGTTAVMTRNGITTKVESEVVFPNGLRVQANGVVTLRDGTSTSLLPNQLLTFDGNIERVALTPEGVAPVSSVSSSPSASPEVGISSRDGITVSGTEAFVTRNGITQRITADVRLPNGVVAKPDGSVIMNNGNRVILRTDQVLGLDGNLRNAPIQPNPAGPLPAPQP